MRNTTLVWIAVFGFMGCAGGDDGAIETSGGLLIEEQGDEVTGSWVYEGSEVDFRAEMLSESILDLEINFDGMTISYLANFEDATAEFDGFTTDTGEETQMTDSDRAMLLALSRELEELGSDVSLPVEKLRGFANAWAEFPGTMDLQGHPPVEPAYRHREDRWYEPWNGVQICDHLNSFMTATHDDWNYGRNADETTMNGYVSWHGEQCSGADGTNFWNNGWTCYEPDHDVNVEYGYGNCFGRCGAGCASSGTFTIQCLDHDECVRVGHDTASFWCNDEFAGTTDDWSFAPNC